MEKIKQFFKDEVTVFRNTVGKLEYLSWWLLRFALAGALIYMCVTDRTNPRILLVSVNILATFTVTLARIILLPKRMIKKLPFRCQTWLNIIILIGAFLGQGLNLNKLSGYDKFLHVLSGAVVVMVGNEMLAMFMRKDSKLSPEMRVFAATGFSYMAIVIWEIFEFFVDYYWPGYNNQAYNVTPDPDMLFFKIFGLGAQNENQWAVLDTNVDMLYAVVGTVFAIVPLLVWLPVKEKKEKTDLTEIKETVGV